MMRVRHAVIAVCMLAAASVPQLASAASGAMTVTRARLANGLRVIVVHDPLAPVVTTMLNYEAGSDEQTIPGLAHAVEHMMFRGSATLSSSQLMDIISLTGGNFDADTQDAVTQYFFTVPSRDLEIALRLERSRATGASMSQAQWNQERGAITQEVTQDNSNALYRLYTQMLDRLVAGTPYANDTLGTVKDFATHVNAPQLRAFYDTWYHPNNAVYVIVGDVDGPATIALVKKYFGDIPAARLPARPAVRLRPVKPATFHASSDLPVTVVLDGYRLPGYDDKDYAAGQILLDVLNSRRGPLADLAATGKLLEGEAQAQSFRKISAAALIGVVPVGVAPSQADALLRGVLTQYRRTGVPAGLVEAAKAHEIAQLEFSANSIPDLAFEWSQAVAVQGLNSPDDMIARFKAVTVADVDRVLRTYMDPSRTVAAYAMPNNTGRISAGGGLAKENNMIPPSGHQPLPAWAKAAVADLRVPRRTIHPTETILPNGIRLIVQPEEVSRTVVVTGHIDNDPNVETPKGKMGVADLTAMLFPYGTATYDRVAFARELDRIAADEHAGTTFSVSVLAKYFDRGVRLLADNELHPRFTPADFAVVKQEEMGALAGEMNAPDHLTEVALASSLYPPGDPMRRFATPQSVAGLTLDDVKAWYGLAYRPDLTTIVVIGDVTPARAKAVIERYFGAWKATGPKPQIDPSPVPPNAPSQAVVPATGRVQSTVRLVETIGLRRTDPSWAAMQVARQILTGGFYSSLLYHDVREVHGYAYYVGSRLDVERTRSLFEISYGCDPKNIVPAEELILGDLRYLQSHPVSSDRLVRAKALLMGDAVLPLASFDGISRVLEDDARFGLPLNQQTIDARNELEVGARDVQAAMAKWIRTGDFVRIVTGPGPQ
jgi:zinc protease